MSSLSMALAAYAGEKNDLPEVEEDIVFESITRPASIKEVMDSFQRDLIRIGSHAKIIECGNMTWFYGRNYRGRDVSFGAHCEVRVNDQTRTFFMCDDTLVGKFTLKYTGAYDQEWLQEFIEHNCPPGG